jgi:hypothetical protein
MKARYRCSQGKTVQSFVGEFTKATKIREKSF